MRINTPQIGGRIRQAARIYRPLKIGIAGVSGSGKTLGSLWTAYGIIRDWTKICVVDTENKSADLYAHLGPYAVLPLDDTSPEGYCGAFEEVAAAGFKVCIVDSLSHEWMGKGGALEMADKVTETQTRGNSFNAWGKVTPVHNRFVESFLRSPMHFICTMRQKDEYVVEPNEKGKQAPRKVGMKVVQREGLDYEFDIMFVVHENHTCTVAKDRTTLFDGKVGFQLKPETGEELRQWSMAGQAEQPVAAPVAPTPPPVNGLAAEVAGVIKKALNEGFIRREELADWGIASRESLGMMSTEELRGLKGHIEHLMKPKVVERPKPPVMPTPPPEDDFTREAAKVFAGPDDDDEWSAPVYQFGKR